MNISMTTHNILCLIFNYLKVTLINNLKIINYLKYIYDQLYYIILYPVFNFKKIIIQVR